MPVMLASGNELIPFPDFGGVDVGEELMVRIVDVIGKTAESVPSIADMVKWDVGAAHRAIGECF